MFDVLYLWVDIIWIPIVYLTVHKKHKWYAVGFVVASMVLIRLLAEIMTHIGYGNGIMGFMDSKVHTRGLWVTAFYYVILIFAAHFSPKTKGIVFMAACLTIFFAIFLTASVVMLL